MTDFFSNFNNNHLIFIFIAVIFVEYLIKKLFDLERKWPRVFLFNVWEFFGIVFPVLWLLNKNYDNYWYFEVFISVVFVLLFGIYKPLTLSKGQRNYH